MLRESRSTKNYTFQHSRLTAPAKSEIARIATFGAHHLPHVKTITIYLYGKDGSIHASGEIDAEKIGTANFVVRKKNYYQYSRMAGFSNAYFRECDQPYTITEF